ncbi:hypothetical protein GI482_07080 [Bacillus sp. N3536]|nr:hypothetical protein GI482_07080 [Bacillus sp. N3536]
MSIGRNELCPCKSGKKYKKCHGIIQEQSTLLNPDIPVGSAINRRLSDAKIKQCIHPDKDKCSEKIIKAHSIQNNRILNRLARNGNLYLIKINPNSFEFELTFKTVGRGAATTFMGFCGHHDNLLFEPIEEKNYIGNKQQHFLFAYRAFSFEFHKKMESLNATKSIANIKPSFLENQIYLERLENQELGIKDALKQKNSFDNALLVEDYEIIETVSWIFDGTAKIAVSSGFFIEYDINGHVLNNLELKEEHMKLLMFSVVPLEDDRTVVLFSWLKKDSEFYEGFREQLLSLKRVEQIQMLNNLIPAYCENTVYNPNYIDQWEENVKQEYLDVYMESLTSPIEKSKLNLLLKTNYNLFQNIRY